MAASSRPPPKFGNVGPWPAPKYICHLLTAAPHPRQGSCCHLGLQLSWGGKSVGCQRAIKDDQCASTNELSRKSGSTWKQLMAQLQQSTQDLLSHASPCNLQPPFFFSLAGFCKKAPCCLDVLPHWPCWSPLLQPLCFLKPPLRRPHPSFPRQKRIPMSLKQKTHLETRS